MPPKKARKTHKKFKRPTKGDLYLDDVATGREAAIEDYLDDGGDPKVRNCKGETALHVAVAHKQNDILERLLPYFTEADLDMRDMYGLPVHMVAVKYNNKRAESIIAKYYKSIKTHPYRFRNYSFANESINNANNLYHLLNSNNNNNNNAPPPLANPIIYPNTANNAHLYSLSNPLLHPNEQNLYYIEGPTQWTYLPRRKTSNKPRSPIPAYNNKNTRVILIQNNKKKTTKKKPSIRITRTNNKV